MLKNYNDIIKEQKLTGRYIHLESILPLLNNLNFSKSILGYSYLNKPIYKIQLGNGKKKILIWSQMHGNESTGTKAIFDLLNYFDKPLENSAIRDEILKSCTITIVPILNPDGAKVYTRISAQGIDLNRDAVDLKAPESVLLNSLLNKLKPSYCFNLHDQRPIFSVGENNFPATISFLAPSEDIERTVTKGRKETMKVIVAMNNTLKPYISNNIGRYTDEFYPTATGDNFQKAGFNTILIESGHYTNDYAREETRKYTYLSLLSGITFISNEKKINYKEYFDIPNNKKKYFEFLLNNVVFKSEKVKIGVYFEDVLEEGIVIYIKRYQILTNKAIVNANIVISKELNFSTEDEIVFYLENNM